MSFQNDVRYAARTLRRSPGYAFVIVLTLALGIGANTALFSVVSAVLLKPLPYEHGERLVRVRQAAPAAELPNLGVSASELADLRSEVRTLDGMVEYHNMWFNLLNRGEPERVSTGVVSWNFFDVLGVGPLHGRTFLPEEDRMGAPPVLVLSHEYWTRRFGADPGVVGTSVEMNDHAHTIVGVLPPIPGYPNEDDVYMPWYACPFRSGEAARTNRNARMLTVFGRLAPGSTPEQAQVETARLARAMATEYPEAYPPGVEVTATVASLQEEMTAQARPTFLILLGMAGLVLLIACANVANLTLARTARREHELGLRAALGAGRPRIVAQLLTESTLLAVLGGALGLLLAVGLTGLLADFASRFTPRALEVGVDGWVLGFAVVVSVATGLSVGTAPVALLAREPSASLREGTTRATGGAGRRRLRSALVAAQLALAFVLLVGAGLMIRSLLALRSVPPGFDPQNVLTMQIDLDFQTRTNAEERRAFHAPLLERLPSLPGVVAAGVVSNVPLNGGLPTTTVAVDGRPPPEDPQRQRAQVAIASPGYFDALRVPLLQGRPFGPGDHADAPPVILINRTMARELFPQEDPVGQRLVGGGGPPVTIVGVVGDIRQDGLDQDVTWQAFVPLEQTPPLSANLVVRTTGEPMALARSVTELVHTIDPRQPVAFVRTLEEVHRASTASPRLTTLLLGLFAGLALVISVAGIVGLVAYSVSHRTRELGVRLALGATPGGVVATVMREGMLPVLAGLAVGLAAALAGGRLVQGLLFRVGAADPATFLAVSALLLAAAAAAAWVPARRVGRIDPVRALRAE